MSHSTRFSDSSLYDEVCTACGATDARPDGLSGPCPGAAPAAPRPSVKAPALLTPADWHGYLVGLAMEAYDRVHERGEIGSLNDVRRERFHLEARERMAQASMVVTCEIDLARGGDGR